MSRVIVKTFDESANQMAGEDWRTLKTPYQQRIATKNFVEHLHKSGDEVDIEKVVIAAEAIADSILIDYAEKELVREKGDSYQRFFFQEINYYYYEAPQIFSHNLQGPTGIDPQLSENHCTDDSFLLNEMSDDFVPYICRYLDAAFQLNISSAIDERFPDEVEFRASSRTAQQSFAETVFKRLEKQITELIEFYQEEDVCNSLDPKSQEASSRTIERGQSALKRLHREETSLFSDIKPPNALKRMQELKI